MTEIKFFAAALACCAIILSAFGARSCCKFKNSETDNVGYEAAYVLAVKNPELKAMADKFAEDGKITRGELSQLIAKNEEIELQKTREKYLKSLKGDE